MMEALLADGIRSKLCFFCVSKDFCMDVRVEWYKGIKLIMNLILRE